MHPRSVRVCWPKRHKEKRERPPVLWLLFLYVFLLPLGLPYVNWASQECCLFYLRSSLWSLDLLLFHFRGLFSSLSVATAILDSFSLFYLPNTSNEYSGLIYFSIDWVDLLAVQGTLNSLLHHHNLKASLRCLRCLQDSCPTTEGCFWVLEKESYPRRETPLWDPWLSQSASFEEEESSVSGSTLRMASGCVVPPRTLSSEL